MSYDKIPSELKALLQWVVYRIEERNGKRTKVPYSARNNRHASSTDSSTWSGYEECARASGYDGIGFVFTADDPYVGVDLDQCVEDGRIRGEAAGIIQGLDSYAEYSVSGKGIHIILKGALPPGGNRKGHVEFYSQGRYFCMTGNHVEGTPETINERSEALAALHSSIFGKPTPPPREAPSQPTPQRSLPPIAPNALRLSADAYPPQDKMQALIENDYLFRQSWQRTRTDFTDNSASAYDMSLADRAALAGWTEQEVVDLLIASRRLHHDDLKLRDDYYKKYTLPRAFARLKKGGGQAKDNVIFDHGKDALVRLSELLDMHVLSVVKYGRERSKVRLEIEGRNSVPIGPVAVLLNITEFRKRVWEATGRTIAAIKAANWLQFVQELDPLIEVRDSIDSELQAQVAEWIDIYIAENPPKAEDNWEKAIPLRQSYYRNGELFLHVPTMMMYIKLHMYDFSITKDDLWENLQVLGYEQISVSVKTDAGTITRSYWHGKRKGVDHEDRPQEPGVGESGGEGRESSLERIGDT